jgi:hypothetical protein
MLGVMGKKGETFSVGGNDLLMYQLEFRNISQSVICFEIFKKSCLILFGVMCSLSQNVDTKFWQRF